MVKEHINNVMVLNTAGHGRMMFKMDMVLKFGKVILLLIKF